MNARLLKHSFGALVFAALIGTLGLTTDVTAQTATFHGPSPYLSFSDSPFEGLSWGKGYFYLEDFDGLSGVLDTLGASVEGANSEDGTIGSFAAILHNGLAEELYVPEPTGNFCTTALSVGQAWCAIGQIDSVEGDGETGGSMWSGPSFANDRLTFRFDQGALGKLPTHVGIVWTDVGPRPVLDPDSTPNNNGIEFCPCLADVTFEAFDADGISLGTIVASALGNANHRGETDDDTFFGVVYSDGISKIAITSRIWRLTTCSMARRS